jgi:hypothetical protein
MILQVAIFELGDWGLGTGDWGLGKIFSPLLPLLPLLPPDSCDFKQKTQRCLITPLRLCLFATLREITN